jgi:hypothetical protein
MTDANSALPLSFNDSALINVTNTTTTVAGVPSIFHGFLVITSAAGAYSLIAYDSATTASAGLVSSTAVGVLSTTTGAGATTFQWGGDIVCSNGITVVAQNGTTGAVKILYL